MMKMASGPTKINAWYSICELEILAMSRLAHQFLLILCFLFFHSRSLLAPCMNHQVFGNGQIGSRGIWGLIGEAIDNVFVSGCILKRLSDKQLEDETGSRSFGTQATKPVSINHIILTGGLGSSTYVTAAVESAIRRDTTLAPGLQTGRVKYENLATDRVRVTDEPQLCVVLGLLDAYRAQLLAEATPVKKARFSFRRPWLFVSRR